MAESASIDQAYDALIQRLFGVFFQSYTEAQGNPAAEKAAETRFTTAVTHARHVRDRAKAVLPP